MINSPADTHPLSPGERIVVFNLVPARRPFIEGHGSIVAPIEYRPHSYFVRLDGDGETTRPRLVLPGDWQRAPQAMLDALMAAWRASLMPTINTMPPSGC